VDYSTATTALKDEIIDKGRSLVDLVRSLHDAVLADGIKKLWSPAAFASLLHHLALVEARLSIGASPHIQLHTIVAAFILARAL
jgi:hypothetical protein